MLPRSFTVAALSALVVTLGAGPGTASVGGTADQADPSPVTTSAPSAPSEPRVLPAPRHGRTALTALGDRLGAVAAKNHLSTQHLRTLLTEDHTAWLSREGRLFYQEDAPAPGTLESAATTAPAYPTSQTFALHSRPGASKTIFLDFDGATVTGSAWNGTGSGEIADGSHIGYDTDGDPSSFSSAESGWIQEVWRQVSETYSPFDVDVTTADPGQAAFTRSSTSDTTYGTHVVITSSTTPQQQVCGGCLGVSWVGSFDRVDATASYQPTWVFAYDAQFDPMIVAQAASHETGHTLGLQHDGTNTADYYPGTSAWGPIMGSSAYRAVSQFSRGEYAHANNKEDDLAIIASHGLAPRADDHGSTLPEADQLGAKALYDASGVIGTRTDTDVFAIDLPCTTTLTATATGIGAQTALDLSLEVLDANGAPVTVSSPASGRAGSPPVSNGMDAQVSVPNATGRYYLRVDGVGNGNPAGSGWSDYGSLGQYRLTGTGCDELPPEPTPEPTTDPQPTTPAHHRAHHRAHADGHPDADANRHSDSHTDPHARPRPEARGEGAVRPADRARLLRRPRGTLHRRRPVGAAPQPQRGVDHAVPGRRAAARQPAPGGAQLRVDLHPPDDAGHDVDTAAWVLRLQGDGLEQGRRLALVRGVTHRRCSLSRRAAPGPCVRRQGHRSATSEPGSPAGSCRSAR